jgi:hypothetical protein
MSILTLRSSSASAFVPGAARSARAGIHDDRGHQFTLYLEYATQVGIAQWYSFAPNDKWDFDLVRQVGGNLSTSYVPRRRILIGLRGMRVGPAVQAKAKWCSNPVSIRSAATASKVTSLALVRFGMCNLDSITTNQAAITALFRVINR